MSIQVLQVRELLVTPEIEEEESPINGEEYFPSGKDWIPQKYDQKHLNDLFRKLNHRKK